VRYARGKSVSTSLVVLGVQLGWLWVLKTLSAVRVSLSLTPVVRGPQGADLLKHGRAGRPKVHFFRLVDADQQLVWRSAHGKLRCIRLHAVQRVCFAQGRVG